ncbi:hypothetical protein, partial [Rhizobium laguerreae]|uniref:hypothetical protein n=1 Tax=Rhizobium laguerreae TaxID=1076926 RepID=UPI001C91FA7C
PGRSTIKTIWLRASSDLQRLTKHENSIVQGIAAASVEVCDKPANFQPVANRHFSNSPHSLHNCVQRWPLLRPFKKFATKPTSVHVAVDTA